jgi:hypothetical protein
MQSTMLAAFEKKQDAENLLHYLESRGVTSALADLTVAQPENAIPADFAKYQVMVAEPEVKAALQVARQTEDGVRLIAPAVHCPECGSLDIIYPNYPRNFLIPFLLRLLAKTHLVDGKYCCLACQFEWTPPQNGKGPDAPSR